MRKKILIIGLPNSTHANRWLSQIDTKEYDFFYFFSIDDYWSHLNLFKDIDYVGSSYRILGTFPKSSFILNLCIFLKIVRKRLFPNYYEIRLSRYINKLKPDVIHTMETQTAGYLLLNVLKYTDKNFIWWHSNWGSDLYIFSKLDVHRQKILDLLSKIDAYSCECQRDVELAQTLGYDNIIMPVYPNSGGFNLREIKELRNRSLPTSNRKYIMVKGYQGWAGRAFVALRALEKLSKALKDYKIVIFSNTSSEDLRIKVGLIQHDYNLDIELLPENTPHNIVLEYFSMARLYIGMSIGDGISTSLLEAMATGCFPIQSYTACANEWIEDKVSGFLVHPEDPELLQDAIQLALTNDALVDTASTFNFNVIEEKLDYKKLKDLTNSSYAKLINLSEGMY